MADKVNFLAKQMSVVTIALLKLQYSYEIICREGYFRVNMEKNQRLRKGKCPPFQSVTKSVIGTGPSLRSSFLECTVLVCKIANNWDEIW